jgi:hypothetical protein
MTRWEYRQLIRTTAARPDGGLQATVHDSHGEEFRGDNPEMQVVNQLGRDGWELVAVTQRHQVGEKTGADLYLTVLCSSDRLFISSGMTCPLTLRLSAQRRSSCRISWGVRHRPCSSMIFETAT